MKSLRIASLVGVVSLLISLQSQAAPMGLTANPPDFFGDDAMQVNYTSSSDSFIAVGHTVDYQGGSSTLQDIGDFTISATITDAGQLTGGSIEIYGDVGSGVELLLSGQLQTGSSGPSGAFGFYDYNPSAVLGDYDIFEFLFTADNGALLTEFGGIGTIGGIILDANFDSVTDFGGDWTADFSSTSGNAVADAFYVQAVPEPSPLCFAFLGLSLCVVMRHRRTVQLAQSRIRT